MQNKSLLVLGAGLDQCFMIRTAKSMGLRVIAVDGNEFAPGFSIADKSILVSNRDVAAICKHLDASSEKIEGVSTMGSDIPHIVAAVAEHLALPHIGLASAEISVNKLKMKQCFSSNNICVPEYELIHSVDALTQLIQGWRRVVIKPLDQAGSRGVFLIDGSSTASVSAIESLFNETASYSPNGNVLVERYLAGPQLSSESLVVDGKVYTPGYADRNYENLDAFLPQIMENGGWVPSLYEHRRADVDAVIGRCAEALGIRNGVIKGDLIFLEDGRIAVVEVAARLSGGDFCESLVPLASGCNYVEQVIRQSLGLSVETEKLEAARHSSVANRYFFPATGTLKNIEGVELVKALPYVKKFELWVNPGDQISKVDAHGSRGGVFVVVGKDRDEVQQRIDHIYSLIKFDVA